MASLFTWPFRRKQYPGIGNPRFVSDIVAANEAVIDAMKALTGLNATDFAIITGLDYTPGAPGQYGIGVFYLNGNFYYVGTVFSEGLYLAPNPSDTMTQPFSDGVSREIYTLLTGNSTSNSAGATPIFSGNMNTYRIGLKIVNGNVLAMQATLAALGNAAFKNVGTTPGTVAAGDDQRFGYTQGQIDSLFARKANVIEKGTNTGYTPTGANDPVNKQYADAAMGAKLLWLGNVYSNGDIDKKSGPLIVTAARQGTGNVRLSHNFGSQNFFVTGIGIDDVAMTSTVKSYIQISNQQFDIHIADDASANDSTVQITMWQYF
jgi:hypothetical protein